MELGVDLLFLACISVSIGIISIVRYHGLSKGASSLSWPDGPPDQGLIAGLTSLKAGLLNIKECLLNVNLSLLALNIISAN